MLDKQAIYELLKENDIAFESYEHCPVYTVEEMNALNLPHPEGIVKNLFLRDDKKRHFYLAVLPINKAVRLQLLRERITSRKLSFASDALLMEIMGLERGHVTPFGALNDKERKVTVVFDQTLQDKTLGIHPMENTASVFVAFDEVKKLIEAHGNPIVICDLDEA